MALSFGLKQQLPLLLTSLFLASLGSGSPQPGWLPRHSVHESMSPSDLRSVFQVESHEQVPEYDVVHLRILNKRSADTPDHKRVNLQAFGRKMQLLLEPNVEFNRRIESLKMYSAESQNSGKRIKYSEESIGEPVGMSYHDDNKMAAVVIRQGPNGNILMDGTIGNDLVIKPVPSTVTLPTSRDDDEMFLEDADDVSVSDLVHLKSKSKSPGFNLSSSHDALPNYHIPKLTSLSDAGKDKLYRKHAHFVFKKKIHSNEGPHGDFAALEPGHLPSFFNNSTWKLHDSSSNSSSSTHGSHRRSKRQSPDTVWPEVLLVVDYDSYLLHGGNSRDVKRYFISFWNGVDLRYKLLSHPRIRVSLAGMIVAKDRDATPYLERNRLRTPNADAVDAAGALTDMGKYLYREDRLPTYDLAVVITKLDMCRRRYEGGRCNRGTAGFAYVGGACVVNKRLEKVNSVAIIEDSGGFSGIIVAAHEVGHLLGCVHDGSPPPSYLGGPGATRCPWEDGFIMSDLRHTERGFRWSSCSVEQFKHFLNGETATCLYNYPHENQLLPRVLPGTMLTLDEQCKRDRGTNACFKDARVCAQLFCFDSASGYCVSYRPAAEGSSCGDGQVCRNGKCTAELENIIPDYTHVTQTVVTRGSDDVNSPSQASCRDKNEQLAGLSCADFLKLYGYRYCNHSYIKRNCCASHGIICNNKL